MYSLPIDIIKKIHQYFHPIHDYINYLDNLTIRKKCIFTLSVNKSWYDTYGVDRNEELSDILLEYSIRLKHTVCNVKHFIKNNPRFNRDLVSDSFSECHHRCFWNTNILESQIKRMDKNILNRRGYIVDDEHGNEVEEFGDIVDLLYNGSIKDLIHSCKINNIDVPANTTRSRIVYLLLKHDK